MLPGACLIAQLVKNSPAMQETTVRFLGWEDSLEKGTATHSSVLAWRTPWTVHGSQRPDRTERLSLSLSYAACQSGRIGNWVSVKSQRKQQTIFKNDTHVA